MSGSGHVTTTADVVDSKPYWRNQTQVSNQLRRERAKQTSQVKEEKVGGNKKSPTHLATYKKDGQVNKNQRGDQKLYQTTNSFHEFQMCTWN